MIKLLTIFKLIFIGILLFLTAKYLLIDISGVGGEIDLSYLIYLPSIGTLAMILMNRFTEINYLVQYAIITLFNILFLGGNFIFAPFLAFISIFLSLNVYTLFLEYDKLKWPQTVYVNSLLASIFIVVNREYGSLYQNIVIFLVLITPMYLFVRSNRKGKV